MLKLKTPPALESVLCTEEMNRRPSRPPDYERENRALVSLAQSQADSPRIILQTLADTILDVFQSDSAGISLVTEDGKRFYWPAVAGVWKPHLGGGTPRDFGPCGDVLDRNVPLLFSHFERRYTYLQAVMPPAEECLLVPFYVEGKAVGTIWAIIHDDRPGAHKFDSEDLRMLLSLGRFASAAYQAVQQLHAATEQAHERQQAEQDLRDMNEALLVSSVRQHELTEQAQKAEASLRESEERFRTLVSVITDVPWTANAEGEFTTPQPAWAAYTGQSWDELCGFGWANALHPDDRPHIQKLWNDACKARSLYRSSGRFWHAATRQYRYFEARATPLLNPDGRVREWVGTCTDVEEQKRAEQVLRESAERLSFMAESMPQKIFTAKPNGDIDYFNQQWMEFTGMALDQIRNWGWTQIVHTDDIGENIRLWKHAIATGEPFQFVHRLKRADGWYRWHLSRAHAMRDASGEVSMWIGSNTDIHDQKEREEQLRETQKLESIGLLAGGIAHDFNNLLTGILGNASILAARASDSDRPLLNDVVKASERAAGLINQLLAYSGKRGFTITRCDLSELIADMLHLIEISIPKMVEVKLALQPDLPPIEADVSQIQQIVMNLVINAAEAISADGGAVSISTGIADGNAADGSKPGRSVCMKVRDSGSGMDEATQAKIFDPFFTTKFLGRGLGLAAVSGIIRSHQGRITVESSPGQGSTFTVVLPAVEAYPFTAKTAAPRSDREIVTGSGLILVVDDDAIVRRSTKAALEHGGYTVLTAENGLDAVNIFQQRPAEITAVLLDLAMPVMGGVEALRRLRETRPDVPVLIASGYSEMVARERFGDDVDANFIQKPFTVEQLLEAIIAL